MPSPRHSPQHPSVLRSRCPPTPGPHTTATFPAAALARWRKSTTTTSTSSASPGCIASMPAAAPTTVRVAHRSCQMASSTFPVRTTPSRSMRVLAAKSGITRGRALAPVTSPIAAWAWTVTRSSSKRPIAIWWRSAKTTARSDGRNPLPISISSTIVQSRRWWSDTMSLRA